MSANNKNDTQSNEVKNKIDREHKRGKIRELTEQERQRLQERLAKAKENDPNIYPIF